MPTLDEIHRRVDAAAGDDPREALIAVRKLLNDDVPWLERRAVQLARREWWDWPRISRLLLRSRQAVRQRFAGVEAEAVPDFATDDPHVKLQLEAEKLLQRWRDADAGVEPASASRAVANGDRSGAGGAFESGQSRLSWKPQKTRPSTTTSIVHFR